MGPSNVLKIPRNLTAHIWEKLDGVFFQKLIKKTKKKYMSLPTTSYEAGRNVSEIEII
jgi:hypothetical protein